MSEQQQLILAEVRNRVGHITLNRPAAYNAINLGMTSNLLEQLRSWQDDEQVLAVVLRATGDKAFCAGGDIRELYDNHLAGSPRAMEFFRQEYLLDQLIHEYSKPLLALAEGLVLGGGMGMFQGAAYRVITENARLGMPETGIGYFPDVGGSYFLSRLAGQNGAFLAVTGNIINVADGLYCGLADHLLPADKIAALDQRLDQQSWDGCADTAISQLLQELCVAAPENSTMLAVQPAIDQHFAGNDVAAIMASLKSEQRPQYQEWASQTLATLEGRSPMAMVMALCMQRLGQQMTLQDCFAMEQQAIRQWFDLGDFIEGVRAVIVDKYRNPQWKYAAVEQVPAAEIETMLSGYMAGES